GSKQASMKHNGQRISVGRIDDHYTGLEQILQKLVDPQVGVIQSVEEVQGVGHRVVHGGEFFSGAVFITNEVKEKIHSISHLAPLHNPANLVGIESAEKTFPH